MTKNERELENIQKNIEYSKTELKVFIADIIPDCCKRENMDDRLLELETLVHTYGGVVIIRHIQKRGLPDYDTYIGSGKLDEIIDEMRDTGANILIFGNILKPHQIYKLNEKLKSIGAKAWDRVDLILKIFERHAKSTEARLQIELAAIRHMGPRIFGMGMELSRQGGGSKLARGKGETNTEIMKRHLREIEKNIRKKLDNYKRVRQEHRKARQRKELHTVGVVGYTNAGKSTLMNALTKKGVLAEDKLFATLGTSVGKMYVSPDEISSYIRDKLRLRENLGAEILINDTIGFIRDLPPDLIDAFSSTLEDSIESDILLHVIDSSDPKISEKIQVAEDILSKIEANQTRIYVFNKIDMIDDDKISELKKEFEELNPIFISAYGDIGLGELKKEILEAL